MGGALATNYRVYEFVGSETVPTKGRLYQTELLPNGQSRVLFGATLYETEARLIARTVSIEAVESRTG